MAVLHRRVCAFDRRHERECKRHDGEEQGSGTVLVAIGFSVLVTGLWLLGLVAGAALDRSRAQNAADAAALASAAEGGEAMARRVAAANSATVTKIVETPEGVAVRVESGDAVAVARAAGRTLDRRVAPSLRAALRNAARVLGHDVDTQGFLDNGLAAWVSPEAAAELAGREAQTGLCLSPAPLVRACAWRAPTDETFKVGVP